MAYKSKPRWGARQENFIRENYEKLADEEIATILGRTLKSVRRKRERMLLKKASGRSVCRKYEPNENKNGGQIIQSDSL